MARQEFRFYPVEEFYWHDDGRLIGKYIPGNSYNCSRNARHDRLYEKCKQWQAEGKIKVAMLNADEQFRIIKR